MNIDSSAAVTAYPADLDRPIVARRRHELAVGRERDRTNARCVGVDYIPFLPGFGSATSCTPRTSRSAAAARVYATDKTLSQKVSDFMFELLKVPLPRRVHRWLVLTSGLMRLGRTRIACLLRAA